MSRLSTHLPQLASLALAVIAAAVSHSVHVDRSASSGTGESRNPSVEEAGASHKARHGSASTGREGRRNSDRSVRRAEGSGKADRASRSREAQAPLARPVVVTVTAHPPRALRPHHVDRLRAGPGVERGVDPEFQHQVDDDHPGVDSPAAPTPSGLTPPDSSATSGGSTGGDAYPGP
jgi:hypothetical protein